MDREADIIAAEHEVYRPSAEIVAQSYVPDYDEAYARAQADPQSFWAEQAAELSWYEPWTQVLDESDAPFYKWFAGGKTNIALNALDRHITTWRKNKLALIWEGEPGDKVTFSYFRLWQEVNRFANVLRSMGVRKGDRVTIYMGRIPELPIAMLACAKIGAVHSVVYGGFSEQALADRIEDAQSRVLITADGAWLRGKTVDLKTMADEAIHRSPVVEHVIVVRRTGQEVSMEAGRDYWYHDLMALPIASTNCPTEVMDAEDPLFILYTSGTTGKPKGLLHTHGGYQVFTSTTLKWVFDIKEEDRWWCAADPGWITGHSYIVYAPLIFGRDQLYVRGRAQSTLSQPLVEDDRALRHQHPLHRADCDPRADAFRRCLAAAARPEQPASAGQRRRANQPRGVALVPQDHRQRELSDHGHLVADRDRRLHDHSSAIHAAETRFSHPPLPRHRG